MHAKALAISATGTGTYAGEALWVAVRNTSGTSLRTRIPAGWVFQSVQEDVQDLLVVRSEDIVLTPGAERKVLCRVMCTQGPLNGPSEEERYRPGAWGSPALVAVAQAIEAGPYDDHLAQAAVWTISNGYSIAGMGALEGNESDTLRMVTSRLSGQPPPRYGVDFERGERGVCMGRPLVVRRQFTLESGAGAMLSVVVLDAQGRVVKVLEDRRPLEPGRHAMLFEVGVEDWPPGRYAIHARTDQAPGVHRLPFSL